ncbi:MAG: pyridoxal phosphate-dependent aminotransferase [Myxococcales bacterium]|jgi:aspartate aminotransferase|nr:pyridoxal phosphate-dependent aminotransferase [Myxococcales bacterium]
MKVSAAAARIPGSPTLAIDGKAKALKAQGVDVVSFSAGEPDFMTPSPIVEAAITALREGHHKYTAVGGTPALKAAIRAYYHRRFGFQFADNEVLASCGAKHSLYNMWLAFLDPGDEVIVPTPAWVSYITQIEMAGAKAIEVFGSPDESFMPSIEALERAYTPQTKAILINNPANPTGALWSRAALERLADWIVSKPGLVVVSDAIYDELVYDGEEYAEILALRPELRERYILINGMSKAFAMTGWRLGYTIAPANLISAMERLQSQSTSNPTSVTQQAAVTALQLNEEVIAPMRAKFQARRDLICEKLLAIPGVKLVRPRGAFYAFPDFSAYVGRKAGDVVLENDFALAGWLLDHARVAVVPGSSFSAPGYLRLSYATSEANITEGVRRIAEAVATLK